MDTAIAELGDPPHRIVEHGAAAGQPHAHHHPLEPDRGPGSLTTVRVSDGPSPPITCDQAAGRGLRRSNSIWARARGWRECCANGCATCSSPSPASARAAPAGGNRYATCIPLDRFSPPMSPPPQTPPAADSPRSPSPRWASWSPPAATRGSLKDAVEGETGDARRRPIQARLFSSSLTRTTRRTPPILVGQPQRPHRAPTYFGVFF